MLHAILQIQDNHCVAAAKHANNMVQTMKEGHPGQAALVKLASSGKNRARDMNKAVFRMGFSLQVCVRQVNIPAENGQQKHPVIPIASLVREIFAKYPQKLLCGYELKDVLAAEGQFRRFWRTYKGVCPNHEVYATHSNLGRCIPCRLHADEGTGARKKPILQCSWGPLLAAGMSSWDRYWLWTSMLHETYKEYNMGFEKGNTVIDSLMTHLAIEVNDAFLHGFELQGYGKFFLVFLTLDGDLPAQAKIFHCARNFCREPNPMCPWCLANDTDLPFTDVSSSAAWRATVNAEVPWTIPHAMTTVPGADTATFLAKDIFHECHLGLLRVFVASTICFLAKHGHFIPCGAPAGFALKGRSIPSRLKEAYKLFRDFCSLVLHETPHVKQFTKENLNFLTSKHMPDCSFKGSDTRLVLQWLVNYLDGPLHFDAKLTHMYAAAVGALPCVKRFIF